MANVLRPGMADLITRLRRLIGDQTMPVGATSDESEALPVWDDHSLQDALDTHRAVVRYAPLQAQGTPRPNTGVVDYFDYYADDAQWDNDSQLFNTAWQPLVPATADFLTGHWTFAVSQIPTVYITGHRYDVFGAAADVCEEWAGLVKLKYDFERGGQKLSRSQMAKALLALADKYREKAECRTVTTTRSDLAVPAFIGINH